MLINTVVLVLRDMLPLFILLVWLAAYINPQFISLTKLLFITLISASGILLFYYFASDISELFDGAGIEFTRVFCIVMLFLTLLVGSVLSLRKQASSYWVTCCLFLGVCLLFITQGANFFIYFNSYLSRSNHEIGVFIGVFLALGFGLSFSTLYYFILCWLAEHQYVKTLNVLWALFLSNILAQVVPILTQVDVLSDTKPLWNSAWLIEDSSEYGHILKALIGYETTPSASFLLLYLAGFTLFYLGIFFNKGRSKIVKTNKRQQTDSVLLKGGDHD